MTELQTVRDIIDLWPSRAALAEDITSEEDPVTVDRVHKWPKAGVIPSIYHWRIIMAARRRGFGLTADDMARVHDLRGRDAA